MAKQKIKQIHMKYAFSIILNIIIALKVNCQIPDDFRFLNHAQNGQIISEVKVLNNQLVSIGDRSLNRLNYDYTFQNVFGGGENYKFISQNDSTMYYATWFFECGDCSYDGLETYSDTNGDIKRQSFVDGSRKVENMHDITYDTLGGWWCLTDEGENLLYLKDNKIESRERISEYDAQLFTSCNGDVYFLRYNRFFYFDGENLEEKRELPIATGMLNSNGFNYILNGNRLYKYNCDLNEKIYEWQLPEVFGTFERITIEKDNKLSMTSIDGNTYEILTIDSNSDISNIVSGTVREAENIHGITKLNESTYLIYGEEDFGLRSHNFYRIENIEKEINYPTVDLELEEFVIDYKRDTLIYDNVVDSIVQSYKFAASVKAINIGDTPIYAFNIYSNTFRSYDTRIINYSNILFRLRDSIPELELEEINLRSNGWSSYDDMRELTLTAIGANYKYLKNPYQRLTADLTTNTKEFSIEDLKLSPNPASNRVLVDIENYAEIKIFDFGGDLVNTEIYTNGVEELDISFLRPGKYILVIKSHEVNLLIGKFIKL